MSLPRYYDDLTTTEVLNNAKKRVIEYEKLRNRPHEGDNVDFDTTTNKMDFVKDVNLEANKKRFMDLYDKYDANLEVIKDYFGPFDKEDVEQKERDKNDPNKKIKKYEPLRKGKALNDKGKEREFTDAEKQELTDYYEGLKDPMPEAKKQELLNYYEGLKVPMSEAKKQELSDYYEDLKTVNVPSSLQTHSEKDNSLDDFFDDLEEGDGYAYLINTDRISKFLEKSSETLVLSRNLKKLVDTLIKTIPVNDPFLKDILNVNKDLRDYLQEYHLKFVRDGEVEIYFENLKNKIDVNEYAIKSNIEYIIREMSELLIKTNALEKHLLSQQDSSVNDEFIGGRRIQRTNRETNEYIIPRKYM